MLTMHPTLLIGPADWDAAHMPQAEFAARIAALWRAAPQAAGAIVYGGPSDHAALAYLTAFTPKLEPAIALVPRDGVAKLMVGGGANMIPAAQPLTWIDDLVSLRPTAKTISSWLEKLGGPCVMIDCDSMPMFLHRELDNALAGRSTEDGTELMQALMQRKSARELACVRAACATLQAAVAAARDMQRTGAGATAVVLAAEHGSIERGAQDVRTLFSLDGGRTLRPFEMSVGQVVDQLLLYIAVRQYGYWAEAFVWLGPANEASAHAEATLRDVISAARPGDAIASPIQANSIGLALDEGPALTLEPGSIYSLRIGTVPAHASAMIAVHRDRIETLWPAI
jgi:hypothetical protein